MYIDESFDTIFNVGYGEGGVQRAPPPYKKLKKVEPAAHLEFIILSDPKREITKGDSGNLCFTGYTAVVSKLDGCLKSLTRVCSETRTKMCI